MKIYTCIRDARNMELNELEAINRRAAAVKAKITEVEEEKDETPKAEEAQEEEKAGKKKNKKRV